MKTLQIVLYLFFPLLALGQSDQSLIITVSVVNEISRKPVDASLEWYEPSTVKRIAPGKYTVVLGFDLEETLTVTRDGYFDSQVKLDYSTLKDNPSLEIVLQPSVPRLDISILSAETEEPVAAAIDLFTLDESSIIFSEEVETTPYTIDLEYNQVHVLQVRSRGFFSYKDTLDFHGVYEGKSRAKTIKLVPLKAGNKISLSNIYFKENEANLTEFAKLMLAELTHVLQQQESLEIEIGAYTDDVGTEAYNLELSDRRAKAVKQYLVEKGAKPAQLHTKGYGEASPVVPNTTVENKALNRRVEFKIVKAS